MFTADAALRLRPSADDQAWDRLVAEHPAGTAFHLSRFLRTAAALLGQRALFAVAEADGEVVGAVPMLLRVVGPVVLVNHRTPFPYLGPLLRPGISLDAVRAAVVEHLRPRAVVHLGLQSTVCLPVPDRRGWVREDHSSAIVQIGGKDDDGLLGLLSRTQRNTLRHALEQGLVTGPATRGEIAGHLGTWVEGTLARQGLPPYWPDGAFVRFYDALAPAGVCRATAVRRDGEVLAVSLDMFLGRRLVGWEMGLSDAGRAAGASVVLHAAVMRCARDLGAAELDMLGAPTAGIAHYKRSLGAELRPRTVAQWTPPWLPPRRYLRRLAALLPATRPS